MDFFLRHPSPYFDLLHLISYHNKNGLLFTQPTYQMVYNFEGDSKIILTSQKWSRLTLCRTKWGGLERIKERLGENGLPSSEEYISSQKRTQYFCNTDVKVRFQAPWLVALNNAFRMYRRLKRIQQSLNGLTNEQMNDLLVHKTLRSLDLLDQKNVNGVEYRDVKLEVECIQRAINRQKRKR